MISYGVAQRSKGSYPRYGVANNRFSHALAKDLVGSKHLPISMLQQVFSFLDPASWQSLPFVNKAWYQAAQNKVFLLYFEKEERVKSNLDSYTVKRTLTRQDAKAIVEQTGIDITIPPGKTSIRNFTLGRGAFGEFCIGYAAKKAHFVGIKITRGKDASEQEAEIQHALSGLPSIMPMIDFCKTIDDTGSPALYQIMELAHAKTIDRMACRNRCLPKRAGAIPPP